MSAPAPAPSVTLIIRCGQTHTIPSNFPLPVQVSCQTSGGGGIVLPIIPIDEPDDAFAAVMRELTPDHYAGRLPVHLRTQGSRLPGCARLAHRLVGEGIAVTIWVEDASDG